MSGLDEMIGPHVAKLAEARLEAIADEIIGKFRGLGPDARQSGDDSPWDDVWEEFKEQVQHGESVMWDFYEDTLLRLCEAEVDALPSFERDVLWFWTDGYVQWREDDEEEPPIFNDEVANEIYDRIKDRAANEQLKNELDDEGDDDDDCQGRSKSAHIAD